MHKTIEKRLKFLKKVYPRIDRRSRITQVKWLVDHGMNMAEIGRQLKLSRQRVHQLLRGSASN